MSAAAYKIFTDVDLSKIAFREQISKNDKNTSRNLYMSADASRGFSRDSNLTFQAAPHDQPLVANYDLSPPMGQPVGGQKRRWTIDVHVPVGSDLDLFIAKLDALSKEEIRNRAAEAFPKLKTATLSDDQLQMVWPYGYKSEGKLKFKVILPPDDEDVARMTDAERERTMKETTKVYEVTSTEGQELKFVETDAISVIKKGCKVLPVVSTNGIWLNETQCGLSFVVKEMLVWPAPVAAGPGCFNLGDMVAVPDKKRTRDEAFSSYEEYHEDDGDAAPSAVHETADPSGLGQQAEF